MAKRIAAEIDGERFGVVAIYLFGSTKNAAAGPARFIVTSSTFTPASGPFACSDMIAFS